MSTCGSFSKDAYRAFSDGMKNPADFMVVAPAMQPQPAHNPRSFFMGEDNEEDEGYCNEEHEDGEEVEPNARMAMSQLRSMTEDIMVILSEMTPDDYLEPWVAAKITMSKQNLSAVADYLKFND